MHIVRRFNASFLRKNIFCQKTVIAIVIIKNIFIDEGLKNPEMTDWSNFFCNLTASHVI